MKVAIEFEDPGVEGLAGQVTLIVHWLERLCFQHSLTFTKLKAFQNQMELRAETEKRFHAIACFQILDLGEKLSVIWEKCERGAG